MVLSQPCQPSLCAPVIRYGCTRTLVRAVKPAQAVLTPVATSPFCTVLSQCCRPLHSIPFVKKIAAANLFYRSHQKRKFLVMTRQQEIHKRQFVIDKLQADGTHLPLSLSLLCVDADLCRRYFIFPNTAPRQPEFRLLRRPPNAERPRTAQNKP